MAAVVDSSRNGQHPVSPAARDKGSPAASRSEDGRASSSFTRLLAGIKAQLSPRGGRATPAVQARAKGAEQAESPNGKLTGEALEQEGKHPPGGGLEGLRHAQASLEGKLAHEGRKALAEFEALHASERSSFGGSSRAAVAGINARWNRYSDVLPYDDNRVRLGRASGGTPPAGVPQGVPEDAEQAGGPPGAEQGALGGYINASLVASPQGEHPSWRYICTQGPLLTTTGHFWQMVYEQRSPLVLMLTGLVEAGAVPKCAAYFPAEEGAQGLFGGWTVQCVRRTGDARGDICRRELKLSPPDFATPSRMVTHLHYQTWRDHGVPSETATLRALCRDVEALTAAAVGGGGSGAGTGAGGGTSGPPVVHCSAGIGRTGTFCAVDIALKRLAAGDPGSRRAMRGAAGLAPLVAALRQQRAGMVQTHEQYLFCYEAVKAEVDQLLQQASGEGDGNASARNDFLTPPRPG